MDRMKEVNANLFAAGFFCFSYGGYSAWRVDITDALQETNRIVVAVDNSPNDFVYIAGPFTMASVMVGVQDFTMMLIDEEEEVLTKLMDYALEISTQMLKLFHENGADITGRYDTKSAYLLIVQVNKACNIIRILKSIKPGILI